MSLCLERRSAERSSATRRLLPLLAVAGALGAASGCARPAPRPYTPPALVVDEAMQLREWERSVAYYPNGDTVSGHNRFPIRSDLTPGSNEFGAAAYDIVASMAQTVALPFTYLVIPPLAPAVYTGEDFGSTYTGMPPMRPDAPTVRVDGREVERETLEVRPAPQTQDQQDRRYGPQGPGDTDFMSSPPTPTQE